MTMTTEELISRSATTAEWLDNTVAYRPGGKSQGRYVTASEFYWIEESTDTLRNLMRKCNELRVELAKAQDEAVAVRADAIDTMQRIVNA